MAECGVNATVSLDQWSDVFIDLYERIADRFARTEVRERLRRYLCGLFERVVRKRRWTPCGATLSSTSGTKRAAC